MSSITAVIVTLLTVTAVVLRLKSCDWRVLCALGRHDLRRRKVNVLGGCRIERFCLGCSRTLGSVYFANVRKLTKRNF